ncbi:UMTA protein [Colletotrichum tabaci]|uniref:UMTA protein n=1 Tax=Colletotrichum tabaci TaxID=1209068 RepID=A0AAV9SWA6_9PEZI
MAQEPIQFNPAVVGDLDDEGFSETMTLPGSTLSLSASVREYRTIHGRTFQTSSTTDYLYPNDEEQIEGFDITHHYLLMLMDDKLFVCPFEKGHNVLDIGTGTGIWAIDFADEFPGAEVIGTDISAIQPGWVPPNCRFQIDDAQLDWTFKKDHFDFIHARGLSGGIDDWQRLYDQAFEHLAPGGWFESVEADSQVRSENPGVEADPDHVFKQWAPLFWEAGDKTGRTFRVAQDDGRTPTLMETCMRNAGFVDVEHRQWKIPVGGWAKDGRHREIGYFAALYVDQGLEGWALRPLGEILGWSYERLLAFTAGMRNALGDTKSLPYFNYHVVYGRKPMPDV